MYYRVFPEVGGTNLEVQKQILRSPPPNSAPKRTNRFLGTPRTTFGVPFTQNDTATCSVNSSDMILNGFAAVGEERVEVCACGHGGLSTAARDGDGGCGAGESSGR